MRITIRVRPGSARPGVGGEYDGALIVRVSARAVDGKATEAALIAVADSFGVRRSAVRLVFGALSRTKIVDIDAGDPRLLASLLAMPGRLNKPEAGVGRFEGQAGSQVRRYARNRTKPRKQGRTTTCILPPD